MENAPLIAEVLEALAEAETEIAAARARLEELAGYVDRAKRELADLRQFDGDCEALQIARNAKFRDRQAADANVQAQWRKHGPKSAEVQEAQRELADVEARPLRDFFVALTVRLSASSITLSGTSAMTIPVILPPPTNQ